MSEVNVLGRILWSSAVLTATVSAGKEDVLEIDLMWYAYAIVLLVAVAIESDQLYR